MAENRDELAAGLRWQQETSNYRAQVLEIAEESQGFAGVELRRSTRELIVFSTEPVPQQIADLIEDAPPNIKVTWRPAPHSLEDLTSEVLRLMREHAGRINAAGARHNGTGIDIATTDQALLTSDDPTRALGARFAVRVAHGEPPIPA